MGALAERHDVRFRTLHHTNGNDVERYCAHLLHGLYGAAYVALGLAAA